MRITSNDLEQGTLATDSLILPDKIYTLSRQIIIKRFGRVNQTLFDQVRAEIDKILK